MITHDLTPTRPDYAGGSIVNLMSSIGEALGAAPSGYAPLRLLPAEVARDAVLAEAGASRRLLADGSWSAQRDVVDAGVVSDVMNGTGEIIGGEEEFGGRPVLDPGVPYDDGDADGMPDVWEGVHGFDPGDPADGPADADLDGYTNVEEFLNGTPPVSAPGVPSGSASGRALLVVLLIAAASGLLTARRTKPA